MISSMTGYGRAESTDNERKIVVEMRSLNHRYLEVSLRLPNLFFPMEMEIKRKVGEHFFRGRVDVSIKMDAENEGDGRNRYSLNLPLLKNYFSLLVEMKSELNLTDEITLDLLSRFKDVMIPVEAVPDLPACWAKVEPIFYEALAKLKAMRKTEGDILYRDLRDRMGTIRKSLDGIISRTPVLLEEYHARLVARVQELTKGLVIDEARLAQEVAVMAERSDITEETVRFRSHLEQFETMMDSSEAVGRKIDFLIQEMGREINTIGSKSSDAQISRLVIEIKSELAKLREQVQNIE
ncbi:TIGR00255 family protein [Syntrophus gentianae]|uniref:TIGR00255 family protein n=1 Tax=Syntrophus gentianae TaxID=43775 RepID=A0A1H7UTW8_9BACT|nr:YicC/YloC family endoribonuclease [Syntrophus gentianae]SEM00413.1 TIGR00255 family protein [Syntrophus gentianae]